MINFDNSYARLPDHMFSAQAPTPVRDPKLIIVNESLAADLGIDPAEITAEVAAGNTIPDGAQPIAQLYAGHQFGNWNPQLGDGRAVLLGEVITPQNKRIDIQLKGSGRTPYSRNGDGRAWLGPVLREYIVSEAMHAMGVPTTRALAAAETGEIVQRETGLPGGVIMRTASSHIRVGTFQVYAARGDTDALAALLDHVIARHYPDAAGPAELLSAVVAAQANLVAQWMGLGFIHGVMNTDNVSIAGETIDYGPCAFMDSYNPAQVFSSIDRQGRYAYSNQPSLAGWNMAQLATALVPLMPDQDAAIDDFTKRINAFSDLFVVAHRNVFAAKLGISNPTQDDDALIHDLLSLMAQDGADFTNTFATFDQDQFVDTGAFNAWKARWDARRDSDPHNPMIIPRNHQIEAIIQAAVAGDFAPFHAMLTAVTQPFAPLDAQRAAYAKPPTDQEIVRATFCGT